MGIDINSLSNMPDLSSLFPWNNMKIVVQVNGMTAETITVPKKMTEAMITTKANEIAKVTELIGGRKIANVVYVPGKLLNFVTYSK